MPLNPFFYKNHQRTLSSLGHFRNVVLLDSQFVPILWTVNYLSKISFLPLPLGILKPVCSPFLATTTEVCGMTLFAILIPCFHQVYFPLFLLPKLFLLLVFFKL